MYKTVDFFLILGFQSPMEDEKNLFPPGIRRGDSADVGVLVELISQLFSLEPDFPVDGEKQARGLNLLLADPDRALVLVAEVQGRVVGMVTVQLVVSTAQGGLSGWLEDLVVHGDYQSQGWGSALLSSALAWAKNRGADRVQLLADRNNARGLEFYSRKGVGETDLVCRRILV